jgi:hypothetical protein
MISLRLSSDHWALISVSIAWGDTVLTLIPYGASCLARVFARASIPAFEGPYPGAEVEVPLDPALGL